jgi:hypothetical protein
MRDEDDYTREEREMFAALPRESAPDPGDEERIIGRLRAGGFFARAGRVAANPTKLRTLTLAIAALLLLACGVLLGAALPRPQVTGSACADLPGPLPSSAEPSSKGPVRTAGVLWF